MQWIRPKNTTMSKGTKVRMDNGETGVITSIIDEDNYLVLIDEKNVERTFHFKYVRLFEDNIDLF